MLTLPFFSIIFNFFKMTIKTFPIVLALALAAAACNNDTPQQATPPVESAPAATTDGTAQITVPQEAAPGGISLSPTPGAGNPQVAAPAPAAGEMPKVNPPHGQPGHVCGTPVGSPLDGSAAKPAAQQPQSAPKSVTIPPPSGAGNAGGAAATVAPGTNPPHGQPGHVCGTPVGAPLPKQ